MNPQPSPQPFDVPQMVTASMKFVLIPKHNRKFFTLKRRILLATKVIHACTLERLHFFDGVHTLLRRGGLGGLEVYMLEVYIRITLEFFSTLALHKLSQGMAWHVIISLLMP